MKSSDRGWVAALLACVLCLGLFGCGRGADEVVVYTSVDEVYSRPIFEAFEKETGMRVRAVYDLESQKTVGLANRLRAEKARPQADVFWSGEASVMPALAAEGVVGEATSFGGRARVLLVNTQLMPDRALWPAALLDLTSTDIAPGTVGIANPLFGTSANHAAALYAAWGAAAGKAFYEAVKARFVILEGNGAVRDQVAAGQLPMGLTDTDDAFFAIEEGAPVEMVFLDQAEGGLGTLVMPNTIAVVAGAPHQDNAARLLAYITAPETQKALYDAGWFALAALRRMEVTPEQLEASAPAARADMEALFLQ